jgi:alpha-N-arabinofuranosidase
LDEHYYRAPQWFLDNVKRYDNYDRKGPKIFAGEYAAQSVGIASPENKNNWQCALSEAAFLTGLERNADVVNMASYAPLFANVDGWQWTPNLIWFDNLRSYGTPDYYVQQLYSLNKGTDVVPITLNNQTVTGQDGAYASAVIDKKANELVIKFINTGKDPQDASFDVKGIKGLSTEGSLTTLQSDNLTGVNSLDAPKAISPQSQAIPISGNTIKLVLKGYSVNVIRVKMNN